MELTISPPRRRLPATLATLASAGLAAFGSLWLLLGTHNPLDHAGRPFSSALTVYPDGWANAVFLGCGLVALAAACWLRVDPTAAPWAAGAAIVALMALMDASTLMAIGYLPAITFGSLLGIDGASASVLLSPGLVLQLALLVTVGSFGWVVADRIRAELRAAAETATPAEHARRLAQATARTRRWTHIAIEAPLIYALTRVLMFFCVPGFDMFAFNEPILWAGLGLAVSACLGAWLTSGLIRPWGEVFPRWLPGLRGRRVPIGLAVVPGLLVAVMVATAAKDMFQSLAEDGGGLDAALEWPLVTLPPLLWPLWAVALAVAAVNYGIRRHYSGKAFASTR